METKIKTDEDSGSTGALFAPLAGIGTFILIMVFCFATFSNNKTAIPMSFFIAAAAGFFIGRLCYKTSLQSGTPAKTPELKESIVKSSSLRIWTSALAFQIFAYFGICVCLGSNLRLVPRPYGDYLWFGFHSLVSLSMLFAMASVFWIHRNITNQLGHLFWSVFLFGVLYASFLYAATWLADPYSIPDKFEW